MNTVRFGLVTTATSTNILLGVLSLFTLTAENLRLAAVFLLACVIIDGCDGMLARYWNATSTFGKHLDSLADMTSFIIATGTLSFCWLQPNTALGLIVSASFLYVVSGAIRLARFTLSLPSPHSFQGLTTTIASSMIATTYLTFPQVPAGWGVLLVVILALLMVSTFPYPKLSVVRKVPMWVWGGACCLLIISVFHTLWLLLLAYILTGPAIWMYRRYSAQ